MHVINKIFKLYIYLQLVKCKICQYCRYMSEKNIKRR